MSVDVFGRNLKRKEGHRGPPGIGYKLTKDGQYDVENKRLCNLATAEQSNDAVNLDTLQNLVASEVRLIYRATAGLKDNLDTSELERQKLKDECDEKIEKIEVNIQELHELIIFLINSIRDAKILPDIRSIKAQLRELSKH